MRQNERTVARKRLDIELRPFRRAAREENLTSGLLRAVRQTLGVPVIEPAAKMEVACSVIYDMEVGELKNSITLRSMSRMVQAMGCKVVYGIVPEDEKTLDEHYERRLWASVPR